MRKTIIAVALVMCWSSATRTAHAGDEPQASGTITLEGGSVGVGIGFSWGSGTLTYQGKSYPISASGFDVGDVGVTNVKASGKVYNLTTLADFDGSYSGFTGGAALVKGGAAVSMVNQNGVRVELAGATEGVKVMLAGDTVTLKLNK